jgi:hypothetical protein
MRGDNKPSASPLSPAPVVGPPIDHVEVLYPPNLGGKSGRDFEKVVDRIYDQKYDDALRELDKWEGKYGQREETIQLRDQLNRIPRQQDDRED